MFYYSRINSSEMTMNITVFSMIYRALERRRLYCDSRINQMNLYFLSLPLYMSSYIAYFNLHSHLLSLFIFIFHFPNIIIPFHFLSFIFSFLPSLFALSSSVPFVTVLPSHFSRPHHLYILSLTLTFSPSPLLPSLPSSLPPTHTGRVD